MEPTAMTNAGYILGIDTSCDETSLALWDLSQNQIVANLISSQVRMHQEFGGVVPELASRAHHENLPHVFEKLLQDSAISLDDLRSVAVTQTPGLIGCLLVGTTFAKTLAYRLQIPVYGVNHLEAHLFSPYINTQPQFPFLGLVVSGGHTAFYRVESFAKITLLGQTVDDAAGEAFDKGAKLLGLGYPGGPIVDKMARQGDAKRFEFTVPRVKWNPAHLSFSGIKTALLQHVRACCERERVEDPAQLASVTQNDLCASLQSAIVRTLTDKLEFFLRGGDYQAFALSGGVAMNSQLRRDVATVCDQHAKPCHLAKSEFCTDNAAMVAYLAAHQKNVVPVFQVSATATAHLNAKQLKNLSCPS